MLVRLDPGTFQTRALNGTFTRKRTFLWHSHWEVAKDAVLLPPPVPPRTVGLSQSGAFSTFFTLISASEDLKGEIIGTGNSDKPFAFTCLSCRGPVNLVLRRWWEIVDGWLPINLYLRRTIWVPLSKWGGKKRQFGKSEWGMPFCFLKSILDRKRHTARGSGNRGSPWTFALRKEREGREGKKPPGTLVNCELESIVDLARFWLLTAAK